MKADQELEKLLHVYLEEYLGNNAAAKKLSVLLLRAGVGLRPVIDHLTFRSRNVHERAEEFIRYRYEHTETIEYGTWFAKVYRRDGYPTLFIDQAFPSPRGLGCPIAAWVHVFGDQSLCHIAVQVDLIGRAVRVLNAHGIEFQSEVIGRHGGPIRQVFTTPEMRGENEFTVLELVERHYGFRGFSPAEVHGPQKPKVIALHAKVA